jgi:carbamoyl-phosphate synthase small subunit
MKCCLSTLPISDEEAVRQARNWQDMAGSDYVKDVSCNQPFLWRGGRPEELQRPLSPGRHHDERPGIPAKKFRVAAFDYGAKFTHLPQAREPRLRGAGVSRTATAEQVREHKPDAVFLSNGPGDPAALPYMHQTVTA